MACSAVDAVDRRGQQNALFVIALKAVQIVRTSVNHCTATQTNQIVTCSGLLDSGKLRLAMLALGGREVAGSRLVAICRIVTSTIGRGRSGHRYYRCMRKLT